MVKDDSDAEDKDAIDDIESGDEGKAAKIAAKVARRVATELMAENVDISHHRYSPNESRHRMMYAQVAELGPPFETMVKADSDAEDLDEIDDAESEREFVRRVATEVAQEVAAEVAFDIATEVAGKNSGSSNAETTNKAQISTDFTTTK